MLAGSESDLQRMMDRLNMVSVNYNMKINAKKTNVLRVSKGSESDNEDSSCRGNYRTSYGILLLRKVVIRLQLSKQKNRLGVTAPPSPGYCVTICFYYVALGHMFVLVGCRRGAGPYVSIMRRWAICLYWLAVGVGLGHMFLLCGARLYVSIGWL